ncbi:hypothetical protein FNH13_02910 [Ornithinimicrobium ciconiae]|uniref:Uncharacterized protein n=1 Tax=Ornithinimicrobium ciconiae TaxID=2594265 RepID=A0A516G7B3_9MICO|nr:hypothetical protein [Ornithinimicrobium ciconiae]QDO87413.1 hypothetical protein FNH13_02910 [Ornithinimicrobium ciconiae]
MAIITEAPRVTHERDRAVWTTNVAEVSNQRLWFSIPVEHEGLISRRSDAALLSLLLPAMRVGKDLHVGGVVTDELLYNVNGPAQAWVRSVLPMYRPIQVSAERVEPADDRRPTGVATGFSAGVDSFSALGDYLFDGTLPDSLRITHLLFNNVGSHSSGDELAASRLAGVRNLSSNWGIPVIDVNSNLDDQFSNIGNNTAFMNTHTVRNAAVAHLLGRGLGTWYYASGYAFRDVHGGPSASTAASDVISLPLLSSASLRLASVGSERTRLEKTLQVAQIASARVGLDVCIDGDPARERNCSRCWKCQQTLVTLDLANELEAFCPSRFDLNVYLTHRSAYMATILSRGHPHDREIIEYAESINFAWPKKAHRRAAISRATATSLHAARAAKRRLNRP